MSFEYNGDSICEQEWAVADSEDFDVKMGIVREEKESSCPSPYRFDPVRKCLVCAECGEPVDVLGACEKMCGIYAEQGK